MRRIREIVFLSFVIDSSLPPLRNTYLDNAVFQ